MATRKEIGLAAGAVVVVGGIGALAYSNLSSKETNLEATMNSEGTIGAKINPVLIEGIQVPSEIPTPTETASFTPQASKTPTATSSNTPEPFATPTNTETSTKTNVPATQTPTASLVATADSSKVYPGEFVFNNLKTFQDPNLNVLNYVINEDPNNDSKADSLRTSLENKFGAFSSDPIKEGGLEQQPQDILAYENNKSVDILTAAARTKVDTLIHYNNLTNLKTFGFRGPRIDTAYLAAIAVDFANNSKEFVKGNGEVMTIEEVKSNAKLEIEVEKIEDSILSQTQDKYTGTKLNADNLIPTTAKRIEEYVSCDVYRAVTDNNRVDQLQNIRAVTHIDNAQETFIEADSQDEILMTGTVDPKTGKFIVDAFNGRSYLGNEKSTTEVVPGQIESVVDEQELPCGKSVTIVIRGTTPTPVFVNTPQMGVTETPHQETIVPPTNTPYRATQNPTSTAQEIIDTSTPGPTHVGTPTAVNTVTPRPATKAPTYTQQPKPSSTPFGN